MKKFFAYLPTHMLLCTCLGICIQFYWKIWEFSSTSLLTTAIILLSLVFLLHKCNKRKIYIFFYLLTFVVLGITSTYITNLKNCKDHYSNVISGESSVIIRIKKKLKSNAYFDKYIAEIVQVNKISSCGNVLIHIQKTVDTKQLYVNNNLFIKRPKCLKIKPNLNPHQFNYKNYLDKTYSIRHQIIVKNNTYKTLSESNFSLDSSVMYFRNYLQTQLKMIFKNQEERSILFALLLGQRQEVSKQQLKDYASAGAIHILAISGLHIGILLILLSFVLKPIEYLPKGSIIKVIVLIILLWLFALLTGLSASVVRAVTMFTFVTLGKAIHGKPPIEFSLVSSMLLLLLVKPMFLFDIGFQLSYLAIFGIIWLQPLISKIYKPNLWILKKIWQLITVSVAAQISTLPLSLYYFHQFPGLFIISNLIIIPFLGLILGLGFLIIIFTLCKVVPYPLVYVYSKIISFLNAFIHFISEQESYILKGVPMPMLNMIFWYVIIILTFQLLLKQKIKYLIILLCSITILQLTHINEKRRNISKREFIIFHKSRSSIIGIRRDGFINIYSNETMNTLKNEKLLNSFTTGENLKIKYKKRKQLFKFQNKHIIIVDSLCVYPNKQIQNSVILLQNSPKINLARLLEMVKPQQIIADGTNYRSYIQRWKETCKKQKTPFHNTNVDGAYIIK